MKKSFLLFFLLLSVPFYAERHVVVTTYEGVAVSSAVSQTDYILVADDSLSVTSMDGTVIFHEALCDIRSIAVQEEEPTSVRSEDGSFGPADTISAQIGHAVKRLEDGKLYIIRDDSKYTINGVQVQ